MQNSLKAGVDIKGPLPILQTSFSFEFFGFDAKTIAERLNFVSSLGNAPSMGIFIQDINITSYMGKAINIPVIEKSYHYSETSLLCKR